jgi:uncharacterized protein DUF1353
MYSKIFLLVLILLAPLQALGQGNFGSFTGTVKVEWIEADRRMRLLDNFAYNDPAGSIWGVPKGAVINGASIPRVFWTIVGSPYTGEYRDASVVHDYHCEIRTGSWQEVHRMFYWAMLARGVEKAKAKLMYGAVYHFGPRWKVVKVTLPLPKSGVVQGLAQVTFDMDVTWQETYDEKSLKSLKTLIEEKDLSLEQIEQQPMGTKVISNEPPSKLSFPGKSGN